MRARTFLVTLGLMVVALVALSVPAVAAEYDVTTTQEGGRSPDGVRQTCPENSLVGQTPEGPEDENWPFVSDDDYIDGERLVWDNFSGAGGINGIRFWGLNLMFDGTHYYECTESPMNFEIKFYEDDAGLPGATVIATYNVTLTPIPTGIFYNAGMFWELMEYETVLYPQPGLGNGQTWVSVQADGGENCWFYWMSSIDGDQSCWHLIGSGPILRNKDVAFCLTRDYDCDWVEGDDHKMHYPQLPDPEGWDVHATRSSEPVDWELADDFLCSETGWIKDIHFWGSWCILDPVGDIDFFRLKFYADIPAEQSPTGYSTPGELLWTKDVYDYDSLTFEPGTLEGYYWPLGGPLDDINPWYTQYNVCLDEPDWFWQEEGTIYWLGLSAVLAPGSPDSDWGWKSTLNPWNDGAVWTDDFLYTDWNLIGSLGPNDPTNNFFWVKFNDVGSLVSSSSGGSGAYDDGTSENGWYRYDDTDFWTIWFYDHPFDQNRYKSAHIDFYVEKAGGVTPGLFELAVTWATSQWSLDQPPEDSLPPLPGTDEVLYVGREVLYDGIIHAGVTLEFDWEFMDYNPEWVGISVDGSNIQILNNLQYSSWIEHDCVGDLNLAFVITSTEEPTGACCYPDPGGSGDILCTVTDQADCETNLLGVYQGGGTTCQGMEACCLPDGSCLMADALCCVDLGGTPQGPGTTCTADEACCLPDGSCAMLDPLCCFDLGGVPQGTGTTCTADEACCLLGGSCAMLDPLCCLDLGGTPQGPGTTCTADEACCLPDGSCSLFDPLCCDDLGGVAQGPGTVCTAPKACCLPDGSCEVLDPLCCDDLGGTPQGAGTTCTDPEACCLPDGSCTMLDPLCCDDLGGVAQGPGTTCTAPEACCLPDGSCEMLDPVCCSFEGGSPQGPGTTCTADEACCLPGGGCLDLDPLCCDDLGGTSQGPGTVCLGDGNGNDVDDACEEDCDCIPGDANNDVTVNITDAVYLISYIFGGGPAPTPYPICSGDANCDCTANITDAVFLITYIFGGGPAPCECEGWLATCGPPLR
jgi:hypothetical protein